MTYGCLECGGPLRKARLDVYWCDDCETAWLIHILNYESFEDAARVADPPTRRQEDV